MPVATKRTPRARPFSPVVSPLDPGDAKVTPLIPPLDVGDAAVAKLTRDLNHLHAASGKRDVAARAEMGRLLLQVRHRLAWGDWRKWLERHAPFTPRTAERAIALHQLQLGDPERFARIAPFGVSKANVFVTLAPSFLAQLLAGPHTIPGTTILKTVLLMTFAELMQVIASYGEQEPADAATVLVDNYRRQVRALIRTVHALVEDRQHIAEDDLVDLHDDLLAAAARLAEAFDFDQG